jgi:large subunit ribosomal protein L30
MASINSLNVTLVKSTIGRIEAHKATVKGLGLRRMHHTVTVQDTPAIRGMINAVGYLLKVSESKVEVASKVAKTKKAVASTVSAIPKKYLNKAGAEDLTVVEGIGPKICEILKNASIVTFKDLASAKLETLQALLKEAGSRYALANPGTWSEQAQLLANGQYDEFEKLTKELDGGVRK